MSSVKYYGFRFFLFSSGIIKSCCKVFNLDWLPHESLSSISLMSIAFLDIESILSRKYNVYKLFYSLVPKVWKIKGLFGIQILDCKTFGLFQILLWFRQVFKTFKAQLLFILASGWWYVKLRGFTSNPFVSLFLFW